MSVACLGKTCLASCDSEYSHVKSGLKESSSLLKILQNVLLLVIFILSCTLGSAAGAPYFNLPWFLQDVVAATLLGRERYEKARNLGPLEEEMFLRNRAAPTSAWIMRSQSVVGTVQDIDCNAFILRDFADWQSDVSQDSSSVPQWREAYHGVSVFADYRSDLRGLTHVSLAAAVVSPGIPEHAFSLDSSGAISADFFEIAATFRSAGFDRMHEAVAPLEMSLVRQETCDDFELYIWDFRR